MSVNSWQSWGLALCGCASRGPERAPCCGLVWQRNRAGTGLSRVSQGVTEGCCISLCAGCCSIITHCTEQSLGPFPHLLLCVRLRTWVRSPTAGSCWHIKMSFLTFWHMLDGLRLPLWSGKSVLRPCFYEDLSKLHLGDHGDMWCSRASLDHGRWNIPTQCCSRAEW